MTEAEVRAIFLLAGYEVRKLYPLANGYWPGRQDPWWLVSTNHGLIRIGLRKRVYSIDWSEIGRQPPITQDDVTKDENGIHAWTLGKAVDYLTELRARHLDRITSLRDMGVTPDATQEAMARFEAQVEQHRTDPKSYDEKWSSRHWPDLFETERAIWLHRVIHDRQKAA